MQKSTEMFLHGIQRRKTRRQMKKLAKAQGEGLSQVWDSLTQVINSLANAITNIAYLEGKIQALESRIARLEEQANG